MTDLAQIALEFCRECLGWQDAWQADGNPVVFRRSRGMLLSDRLDHVMNTVSVWCDNHQLHCLLKRCSKEPYEAAVTDNETIFGQAAHADPCHALLAACVEANRKLKGATVPIPSSPTS